MFSPNDLLRDKLACAAPKYRGWSTAGGNPLVFANSDSKVIQGRIGKIPPRGVAVACTFDLDVAVGWQSPIAGKVNVRAKVARDYTSADGVSWAIIHSSRTGQKVLAKGTVDRVESLSVPAAADADALAAVNVQKGDGLCLLIGA